MHRFGLHVMGDVAAMALDTLVDQFGVAGRTAWELCRGIDDTPLVPMKHEESVEERISMPFSSNSLEFLLTAVDTLLKRAYSRPDMRGRYAGRADLRCALYGAVSWERSVHFKQSSGTPERASFIIRSRLETDPSTGAGGGGHPDPRRPHRRVGGADGPAAGRPRRKGAAAGGGGEADPVPHGRRRRSSPRGAGGAQASCSRVALRAGPGRLTGERGASDPYPLPSQSRCAAGRMASPSKCAPAIAGTGSLTWRTPGASICGGCRVLSPVPTTG